MVIANQLFDALTAANVPRDQAHAVVDALEHRMTSELATKADIAELRTATKADLAREIGLLRTETKAEFAAVRAEMKAEFAAVRAEIAALRAETKGLIKDLQIKLLVYLGGLQAASTTILFFALDYVGR